MFPTQATKDNFTEGEILPTQGQIEHQKLRKLQILKFNKFFRVFDVQFNLSLIYFLRCEI